MWGDFKGWDSEFCFGVESGKMSIFGGGLGGSGWEEFVDNGMLEVFKVVKIVFLVDFVFSCLFYGLVFIFFLVG